MSAYFLLVSASFLLLKKKKQTKTERQKEAKFFTLSTPLEKMAQNETTTE